MTPIQINHSPFEDLLMRSNLRFVEEPRFDLRTLDNEFIAAITEVVVGETDVLFYAKYPIHNISYKYLYEINNKTTFKLLVGIDVGAGEFRYEASLFSTQYVTKEMCEKLINSTKDTKTQKTQSSN